MMGSKKKYEVSDNIDVVCSGFGDAGSFGLNGRYWRGTTRGMMTPARVRIMIFNQRSHPSCRSCGVRVKVPSGQMSR